MPKILIFVILLAGICIAQSQSYTEPKGTHEVSVWSKNSTVLPWYFYTGKKVVVDTRFNLDEDGTAGFCIGKAFGKESLALIPEACGYAGKNSGYGPELWILSETKRVFIESYIQYAKMVDANSFGYAWLESELKLSKRFGLGLGGQFLKEDTEPTKVDLGPSIKFTFGKMYIKVLPLVRTTPEGRGERAVYSGIGFVF